MHVQCVDKGLLGLVIHSSVVCRALATQAMQGPQQGSIPSNCQLCTPNILAKAVLPVISSVVIVVQNVAVKTNKSTICSQIKKEGNVYMCLVVVKPKSQ